MLKKMAIAMECSDTNVFSARHIFLPDADRKNFTKLSSRNTFFTPEPFTILPGNITALYLPFD
jgi:hypothetical protein